MPGESTPKAGASWVGLCFTCRHGHRVATSRSVFWRCGRSADDARYEKYPRLPMTSCPGYEPRTGEAVGASGAPDAGNGLDVDGDGS